MVQGKKMSLDACNTKEDKGSLRFLPQSIFHVHKRGIGAKRCAFLLLCAVVSLHARGQMLFSENLTLDIDSTKTIQGSLQPELDFKTEKENVLTFKNTANLNLLIERKRIINLINKFEFSSYGKKITVSGGYVHAEYRYLLQHRFEVYPYMESQWAGSRGMTFKLSAGLQARYKFIESKNWLLFANTALFYEFEKWEYPDPPAGTVTHAYSRYIKHHLSFSIKCKLGTHWDIITTGIYQARPDSYFKTPRFGAAIDLAYHITPKIGLNCAYRLIYDTAPIVPVRKNYTTINAGINIAF
ncbi:hypothetical protein [Prevotella nigrescens]|uniref:hypothetical protein n=1 Tax=Prevotella nigrescens TaxID=28133 RepID=UPI0002184156|nr:hypothetical protein [Prevotella nigrescens]EGQ12215.1 hypothetical protein HMPREF9419_2094 [Prevotella nigrescens ATCC 33563]UAK29561.1 hypothetical protein K8O81_09335 [Prevotella nigrescens]WMS21139.1 hypothetical protein RDV52_01020 [Prevotella nigrescens]SUB97048.1 Uncharacterised protein [Prevotella nigrescens]